jgi:hypothetical protein
MALASSKSVSKTQLLVELTPPLASRLTELQEQGFTKTGLVRRALDIYLGQLSPEVNQRFIVELHDDVAEMFAIYRDLTHLPERSRLVETALRAHIQNELANNSQLRGDFENEKSARAKRVRPLKEASKE